MTADTETISGYTYGTSVVAPSLVTMEGLTRLKQAAIFTAEDERWLLIPLRYLLAFPVILPATKPFPAKGGDPATDVELMYAAWCKTVLLQVTLWSRAYCGAEDW